MMPWIPFSKLRPVLTTLTNAIQRNTYSSPCSFERSVSTYFATYSIVYDGSSRNIQISLVMDGWQWSDCWE
ncbi:protein of unknown function [Limnospira indica PCC 8005]|uniref:Uncharacterized protein n=1 Tax=Limnospira indica PCC 8005 TaxID=376219 RepID=A0A9P1P0K0_9CYAN|nr:protein of unknown function [Limnospira indica PCC 8005]